MARGWAFASFVAVLVSVASAATIHAPKGVHGSVLKNHDEVSHAHDKKAEKNTVELARVDASGNVMLGDTSQRPQRVSNVNAPPEVTQPSSVLRSEPAVAASAAAKSDSPVLQGQSTDETKTRDAAILEEMKSSVLRSQEAAEQEDSKEKSENVPQPAVTGIQDTTQSVSQAIKKYMYAATEPVPKKDLSLRVRACHFCWRATESSGQRESRKF
jgi:hypothetical protein